MITLNEVELKDLEDLQKNLYQNKSLSELENMLFIWKTKTFNGKYFEMLGVFNKNALVGIFSLAEQTKSSVSLGIEIFEQFRGLGYGYEALMSGLEKAKQKGYKLTVNQVRTDNTASMALCKKCGLESEFYEYLNKKGNKVYIYIKQL